MRHRAAVQGFNVDLLTSAQALEFVADSVNNGENIQVVTINPEMIDAAHKNPDFARILKHAELVIPDSVGIILALKLKGIKQEKIRGIDFANALIELSEQRSLRLALLGAKPEVLNALVQKLKENFKNLNIVYAQDGYFDNEEKVVSELKKAAPQVLLCAMGAPKQEFLIYRLKNELSGCAMVGVGGSFDVYAGFVNEAPAFFKRLSLEWLYRVASEPRRLKRIFPALPRFLFRSIMRK
ncbi:N-acetylglucosaminyldiphosphoundecaprenol N-acetyl-beta-D-mannosaminyltransferase [Candidatus Gastranaerophilus sp. (ex Termes propinquus)]|nr:N-acetylglucosaminyldiphosphoundecaprenol N-acetyl-beta-D-mannosaminyltransferase [Candidatus Gastranaerophilus sp. (ex Termes propinquus)]